MKSLTGNSELMMERSMRFLWAKQTAILDNIANAETPGYKAKYVTFEDTFRRSLSSVNPGYQPAAHYREEIQDAAYTVRQSPDSERMDENGVDLTEQGVELARNTYQLQYAMSSINSNLNILRTAIKGQ
jgi:flagellar basal-body rod protein FlgB